MLRSMTTNRNQTTVVIALLDKAWPLSHAFVDGMLATEAAQQPDLKIRLCVSHSDQNDKFPKRYKRSACLASLLPRRGIQRILNLLVIILLAGYQARRERKRGHKVVIFVRNDPIFLLASSMLRMQVDRLIFQSSFPHEEYSGHLLKRAAAKLLYRIAGIGVDAVTGVSPEGTARAQKLCIGAERGPHMPLLADMSMEAPHHKRSDIMQFLYIGTHAEKREIEIVLKSIVNVCKICPQGVAEFRFIGGSEKDISRLSAVPGIPELIDTGAVTFLPAIPRSEIPEIMASASIGISLIPPKPEYYESSPTKLAEYMGAGLAVLGSYGIAMQERFIEESGGGVLTVWDVAAITEAILGMIRSPESVCIRGYKAFKFARDSLQYKFYLQQFRDLISP